MYLVTFARYHNRQCVTPVPCSYDSNSFHNKFLFFFSSRRRHTRSKRDWSSDVCSSDLDCSFALTWNYPRAEIKNIAIEEKGKFRAEGTIQVEKKALRGAIELGVARHLLDWLPKPEEVFPHEHDGYLWTTVHLSGTTDAPQQDLSPRIMEVLKENPGAALGLLLRQFGEWLKKAFGE